MIEKSSTAPASHVCPTCGQSLPSLAATSASQTMSKWHHTQAGFKAGLSHQLHPIIKDAGDFLGSITGAGVGAFYGWHHLMKRVEMRLPGRPLLQLCVGVPIVGVFAATIAGIGYGTFVPLLQLGQKSYFAAAYSIRGAIDDIQKPNK